MKTLLIPSLFLALFFSTPAASQIVSHPMNNNTATRNILVDNSGNDWAGCVSAGLASYDGTTFTYYNESNSSISSDYIDALNFDNSMNLWIAPNGSLDEFNGVSWNNHIASGGWVIRSIEVDNSGIIWIAQTGNALIRYDGVTFTYY